MRFFVPLETADPQTDAEFAGMTQVMNIHVRTILISETGDYLFPRGVAMVNSASPILESCIEKGWVEVITSIPAQDGDAPQQEVKKRRRSSSSDEQPSEDTATPAEAEQPAQDSVEQSSNDVAPQDNENSL